MIVSRTRNYFIADPKLSEPDGLEQCAELQQHLRGEKRMAVDCENVSPRVKALMEQVDLIVTSPLTRTCQTTMSALSWLVDRGVKVIADARLQETSAKPCDTGSAITSSFRETFPAIDFSPLDHDAVYPRKSGPYACTQDAIEARAHAFLAWARSRPERAIVAVSHAGFLRVGLVQRHFMNADYRVFDFASAEDDDAEHSSEGKSRNPLRLVEWPETASSVERQGEWRTGARAILAGTLSGGLRRSYAGVAEVDARVDFS